MTDSQLLEQAVGALLKCECGFWACKGFDDQPKDMITCHRCCALHRISSERPGLLDDVLKTIATER